MKILITAPSLETSRNVSGISSVARQIIERGADEFVHFQAGKPDDEKRGIFWFLKQTTLAFRFIYQLKKEKIDVVHLNTALNPLSILRDSALAATAKRLNYPVLLHVHGGKFMNAEFDRKIFERLTRKMMEKASVVVVLSETEREIIEKYGRNLNVRVLENAVSLDKAQSRKRKTNEQTPEKTIIFLGRIDKAKGLREIIEASRVLRAENFDFRFELYGAGDAKTFFVAEMSEILGEKFHDGGVIAGDEKWKALSEADIFLLPSHFEGLPVSLLEALAAGCVVVASNVGSIGAVVKDGANGFIIEPKNVEQLVEKLKMLLSNRVNWDELRQNARETIEKDFNLDKYLEKLERIYAEISENS